MKLFKNYIKIFKELFWQGAKTSLKEDEEENESKLWKTNAVDGNYSGYFDDRKQVAERILEC